MGLEEFYNQQYEEREFKDTLARRDRLAFLFDPIPTGLKVLNVGCGPGVDVQFLVEAGNEVHGVDISDRSLAHAEERGLIAHKLNLEDVNELPFPDSAFDLIVATDILEHLFLPQKLLKSLRGLLVDEGVLIASVPNHFFWKMRLRMLKGGDLIIPFHRGWHQWDYFHIRFFTSSGFEDLLDHSGFLVFERHYDTFITVPRGLPLAMDRKLAARYPDWFSMHFIVKARRKPACVTNGDSEHPGG